MLISMATGSRLPNLPVRGRHKARLPVLAAALTLAVGYWFPVRRWMSRWGTTPDELTRVMPGDDLIANPTHTAMQAVTVNDPADYVEARRRFRRTR